ncbi:hypothetical protein BDM02DRAFT_3115891 [Thelephora ganbajun]|uniref:Uncharacterized protein n=1 Tax=Thelephora ganbajun TaxID=370292 RepID=A0ACB6ZED8_THEGA|nr:hypothetical protein BDM02DRAFT_3115891 [Thelephora ganbajun]
MLSSPQGSEGLQLTFNGSGPRCGDRALDQKRPCSVTSSSSVSGSASPALPWSIHHHVKGVHPPDNSTSTPPMLSSPTRSSASPGTVSHNSNSPSPLNRPIPHADDDVAHDVSSVSTSTPLVVIVGDGERGPDSSGQRTPSRKVIATLQSKSAWDVLIHGSMV